MTKYYLTTAIDYVNGSPHIGHAYEKIQTDVLARHFRQRGFDVYFLTGTDEHGIKIQKTAQKLGITPQQLCDENSQKFADAWKLLDISYDQLIRTSYPQHEKAVQKIFQKLLDKGDIYKHSYTGLYCAGCETFLNERDLDENGCCPTHKQKPELIKEENYFFKLTKYKDRILNILKNDKTNFIRPDFRRLEVINQLENIEDISVSRVKSSVNWGIPVLSDDNQVVYVWIDALSNYITALGYDTENDELFKNNWPADVQVIGKDILKFHSIYWIAILMALDLPLPKNILAHGWITIDETKISKTLNNVIAPKDIINEFKLETPDAFRYFLVTAAPIGKDGNYSDTEFKEKVNSDLANNIGNLLNRSLNMLVKYFDGTIEKSFVSNDLQKEAEKTLEDVKNKFDKFEITEAAQSIIALADNANKYVNDKAPWTLAKNGKMQECANVLYNVLETMRFIAVLLAPYCPNISQKIYSQLNINTDVTKVLLESLKWGELPLGKIIEKDKINPVFLRLDSEIIGDKKKC